MEHYGWAQYLIIFLYMIDLSAAFMFHGRIKAQSKFNFHHSMIGTLIGFFIFKSGGFF